jgi:hypothetical protein
MSLQYITLNEARQIRKLWNGLHRSLQETEKHYERLTPYTRVKNMDPRSFRVNARQSQKAQANLNNYIEKLQRNRGITRRNVHNNFSRYMYAIPGSRVTQATVKQILHLPLTRGSRIAAREGINEAVRNLTSIGIPRANATRNVLKQTTNAGLRATVAVRTLQRAFRAKRAAKKNPLHIEMNALRRVPVSGIRMNNGNVRPLKPSDIAKARQYLKNQGVRMVIPRTTPRRRAI